MKRAATPSRSRGDARRRLARTLAVGLLAASGFGSGPGAGASTPSAGGAPWGLGEPGWIGPGPALAPPGGWLEGALRAAGSPAPRHRPMLAGVALALALLLAMLAVRWRVHRAQRPLHGAARFARLREIAAAGLLDAGDDAPDPRILIGRHRGRLLSLPGQLSVMLSAPTRGGKGVGVVIPNLLHWPDSAVVLDIKGENYELTAGYRAGCGQAVYAFSPFDEDARSHRWNPLSAVRTDPMHRIGDLLGIAQAFFPNDGAGSPSEAFFADQARNVFLGLGLMLLESPELPRTIGEMLRQSSGQGRSVQSHLSRIISQRREQASPARPALSAPCVDALQRLLSSSENTLSSIVATFNAPLTIFADAVVDAATSADDFRLEDLRRRPMTVYVRVPPHRLASARPLLNLFFSQLVSLNTRQLPQQDPRLRFQCLLVHDEFAALGRVGVIVSTAAFLAGYNLRLLTVVQATSQLDATYGEHQARTFATNHGLQILFAPREQRDAQDYSAMLGHYTERATARGRSRSFGRGGQHSISRHDSDQRRALLLPQEFKALGSERLVVIAENCRPILGEKIRYHRDPYFVRRLRPAPPVPPMDMVLHFERLPRRDGACAPDPDAASGGLDRAVPARASGEPGPGPAVPASVHDALHRFFERSGASAPARPRSGEWHAVGAPQPRVQQHPPCNVDPREP